ncbi:phage tail tape measure protein [Providencia rettgeri]|nr:phage tail tape measure protein [Providencia rettgeri]
MTDIATISLKADTSDLERGTQKLKEFGSTAEKVNSSAENLNEQMSKGVSHQKKISDAVKRQRKDFDDLLDSINPTNKAFQKLDEWQAKLAIAGKKGLYLSDELATYNKIIEQTRDKLIRVEMSLTAEGQALLAQEAATNRAKQAADDFLNSLKNQADIIGKTRTEILELKAAQMGVSQQAAPMIAKLKEQEKAFLNGSITIGQYRNAMRQLPMQMTDIVTSLASGMPLWLVMVQQGGQIKDSFGGVGNSLKALMTFFTPARIAMLATAGALTAIAVAAYKGSTEFGEYNKQLILTGGYAGKTASQLDNLAKKLSGSGITQYSSSKVLSQVVGSGVFKGAELELVTSAAIEMQEKVGIAADETIKSFQKIKESPTKAADELNSKMHFLTSSQYEYIASLESRGFKEEASMELMRLYGDASKQAADKVVENLGWIEKAAKAAKNAIGDIWDVLHSFGRSGTTSELTKRLESEISRTQSLLDNGTYSSDYMRNKAMEGIALAKAQLTLIEAGVSAGDLIQQQKNKEIESEEKQISSIQYKNKIIEEGLSKQSKRANDLARLWREVAKAPDKWTQAEREIAVSVINKRHETKTHKGSTYRPDYGTRADESANQALLSLQAQLKVLKEHKTVSDVISAERKKHWDMEAKISVLEEAKATRKLTKDEQALLSKKESVLESQKALAVAGDAVELQKQHNRELDRQLKLVEEINARGRALYMGAGKSDRMYQRDIALEQAKSPSEKKALEDYYSKEDSLRSNWEAGIKKGFAEFQDQATNIYANVAQISQSAFQGMSNSIADFAITGKAKFGDFFRSFLEMTTKMLMQMAMLNAMKAAFGGTAVGNFLGMAKFDSGGYTGDGGKYDPAGIVHRGEFVFDKDSTAKLGKANLYRLMDAGKKGYASGGYVGGSQPMSVTQPVQRMYGMQGAGGTNININMGDFNFGNTQQQPPSSQMSNGAVKREFQQMVENGVNTLLRNPASALSRTIKGN